MGGGLPGGDVGALLRDVLAGLSALAALVIYGCALRVDQYGWHQGDVWSADSGLTGVRCHYYGAGVVLRLAATSRAGLRDLVGSVLAEYVLPDPLERPASSWSQLRLL